jgi:hypothetical protein
MAGLVPAIHVFSFTAAVKTWMPGTSPGMTISKNVAQLVLTMLTRSGFARVGPSLTGRSLVPNTTFSETME